LIINIFAANQDSKSMARGNPDKLIPNNKRTESERSEIGILGGKASGVVRKRKKLLRETLTELMQMQMPTDSDIANICEKMGIKEATVRVGVALALLQRALQGDVSAFNAIRDTIGEKPTDALAIDIPRAIRIDVVNTPDFANNEDQVQ